MAVTNGCEARLSSDVGQVVDLAGHLNEVTYRGEVFRNRASAIDWLV